MSSFPFILVKNSIHCDSWPSLKAKSLILGVVVKSAASNKSWRERGESFQRNLLVQQGRPSNHCKFYINSIIELIPVEMNTTTNCSLNLFMTSWIATTLAELPWHFKVERMGSKKADFRRAFSFYFISKSLCYDLVYSSFGELSSQGLNIWI